MKPFEDPEDERNGPKYHTGKPCIECEKPAGTKWGKHWCFEHNVKRMNRISKQLEFLANGSH